jgi:hypothetical protein
MTQFIVSLNDQKPQRRAPRALLRASRAKRTRARNAGAG